MQGTRESVRFDGLITLTSNLVLSIEFKKQYPPQPLPMTTILGFCDESEVLAFLTASVPLIAER